jgi:hypothetical protein
VSWCFCVCFDYRADTTTLEDELSSRVKSQSWSSFGMRRYAKDKVSAEHVHVRSKKASDVCNIVIRQYMF